MHDIWNCSYCMKEFEREYASQPKTVRLATLSAFITVVAEGLDGKTEAEVAASSDLMRDADWLKRAPLWSKQNRIVVKAAELENPTMTIEYVVNGSGERVSVILPIAEYEALLRYIPEDETAYLISSPENAVRLTQAINDHRAGRKMQERELLPD